MGGNGTNKRRLADMDMYANKPKRNPHKGNKVIKPYKKKKGKK